MDFYNLTAEKLHNVPEGWQWYSLDCHNKPEGFIEVKGAVPIGVISKGPRKGMPKWPKESQTLWMKFSDIDKVRDDWELETGKCSKCSGRGQEFASAGPEGVKYRKCSRCNATGLRPIEAKADQ